MPSSPASDARGARRLPVAALRRVAGRFTRDDRGATAVEFALVSSIFITALVFVMMLGLLLYLGQALDRATALAARQIMIGAVQKANLGQSAFQTSVVCPALPAAMTCNSLTVNVQTVPKAAGPSGYYALVNANQTKLLMPGLSNTGAQYNPGTQGAYVYLQVVYPITFLPAFMANLLGGGNTYNGSAAYLLTSTAAFRNEQY